MRLFIGIYPSEQVLASWKKFQETAPRWPIRWMPPESLHFTLKFLGEINPALEVKIQDRLKLLAGSTASFTMDLRGGGVFPPKGPPSIFWAGVGTGASLLTELAHVIDLELKTIGFQAEKRAYHPHMTVARPIDSQNRLNAAIGKEYSAWIAPFSSEPFEATQLCLIESRLGSIGSIYIVRQTYDLQ